jgi:TRAP-type mannitol/chloroaromatic compound transport system permease large subunit
VAPVGVSTGDIYRGAVPFILLQLSVVLLILIFPQLVTTLPSLASTASG